MKNQLITPHDLNALKEDLLHEIKLLLNNPEDVPPRKWIKSREVRKMLGISPGTLQHIRVSQLISYTRVGGLILYDAKDVIKFMEENKQYSKHPKK
jgi:hypothetical protein